jgi:putative endopeptidase
MEDMEDMEEITAHSGIEFIHQDHSIRAQDDFFRFVNGKWLKESTIPHDRSSDGAFTWLRERSEKQVKEIIEELAKQPSLPGSVAAKIGDIYTSFMDESRIEEAGISPIAIDLMDAQSISSADDLLQVMGNLESRGGGGLFYTYISNDQKNSSRYIAYLGQSGLSLPDESYYHESEFEGIRISFVEHMAKMFALAGIEDGRSHSLRILELEKVIASFHWDQVRDRNAEATYNKMTFQELQDISDGFNWILWLSASKTPQKVVDEAVIRQPSFFTGIGNLLKNFDRDSWSSWLMWHIISGSASFLSKDFVDENFNFYGKTLSGTPDLRERWKRGVSLVEGSLGEAIGEIYVERHFSLASKDRMMQLVDNLIEAFDSEIESLAWMTPPTKKRAREKLQKFVPKIGFPDKWRDYSALQISSTDLIGNLSSLATFEQEYEFAKLGSPIDRLEWHITPQTVNAYYSRVMNEIVFPAAILQAPFFDLRADDAVNYGGIGAVIGHEMGHGFDDQGSKYDGEGNLQNWWSDADRREFELLTAALIEQYEGLQPEAAPDAHVNGALTIGENIGDLGGLMIAYRAYQISLRGEPAPVIDGLTGDQRFFISYAQIWRGKVRPEEVRRRIVTDPHSPPEFRVNQVLKNIPEFYEAFEVQVGDGLYLPESDRVKIW